jgi:hypothetical protein
MQNRSCSDRKDCYNASILSADAEKYQNEADESIKYGRTNSERKSYSQKNLYCIRNLRN